MAAKQTKRGYKYRVLPTNDNDTFNDFLNDDSEFNMNKLDEDLEKLDDKVLLDGKRQQNFKFIENETLSSILGVMSNKYYDGMDNAGKLTIASTELTEFMMVAKFKTSSGGDVFWTNNTNNLIVYDASVGVNLKTNGVYSLQTMNTPKLTNKETELVLQLKDGVFSVFVNGRKHGELFGNSIKISTLNIFGNHNFTFKNKGQLDYIIISDKVLTPQEIETSLAIHNNSPSIKELHTTDSEGKTSILKLASDTDHVEDRSGRTQEQINRTFYKRGCEEFTSVDGSPITVNNGEEGYVLSAEIKGQTIKNAFNKKGTINKTKENVVAFWEFAHTQLQPKKLYTLYFDVKELTLGGNGTGVRVSYKGIDGTLKSFTGTPVGAIKTKGLQGYTFTTPTDLATIYKFTLDSGMGSSLEDLAQISDFMILEGDCLNKITSYIPFGLNSTQAMISNSGQPNYIYEPTIKGKTRILKSPKGTQNWVEISPNEDRDTTKFDYKLESINGDLGSVPNASDYVDRVEKVKVINTSQIKVDENNTIHSIQNIEGRQCIRFAIKTDDILSSTSRDNILSDLFKTNASVYSDAQDEEGICSATKAILVRVLKSKLTSYDLAGINSYLKTNSNTIRYQVATPQQIQLTHEQFKAYDAYKKLISLGGVDDVKDTLEIKEDGSGVKVSSFNKYKLTGSENIELDTTYPPTDTNYLRFRITTPFTLVTNPKGQCSVTSWIDVISTSVNKFSFGGAATSRNLVHCIIEKDKLKSQDSAGMAEWLRNNNVEIEAQVTPLVTTIPKEVIPSILTHNQTNILNAGNGVNASSFTVTLPTTDGVKKEYGLSPINNWTGTARGELLQTGDIRLVLDLTIPSTFNALITNLPSELRPKAERTVLGYNGNTPVVVKIGTDGSVKLPVSATGTIKLNDTYEL